jgi:hypothetical protein
MVQAWDQLSEPDWVAVSPTLRRTWTWLYLAYIAMVALATGGIVSRLHQEPTPTTVIATTGSAGAAVRIANADMGFEPVSH